MSVSALTKIMHVIKNNERIKHRIINEVETSFFNLTTVPFLLTYRFINVKVSKCKIYPLESIFPNIREHATATEKARTKIIGLMTDCTRAHTLTKYKTTTENINM